MKLHNLEEKQQEELILVNIHLQVLEQQKEDLKLPNLEENSKQLVKVLILEHMKVLEP